MTHAELVQRAVRWLQGPQKCAHVFAEFVSSAPETPDVIGFSLLGGSVVVEVKTSRADFKADASKPFRQIPNGGMGQMRWFLTPPGLLKAEELPEGWGLVEALPRQMKILKPAVRRLEHNWAWERIVLLSVLRRHDLKVPFDSSTGRFVPLTDPKHPRFGKVK